MLWCQSSVSKLLLILKQMAAVFIIDKSKQQDTLLQVQNLLISYSVKKLNFLWSIQCYGSNQLTRVKKILL